MSLKINFTKSLPLRSRVGEIVFLFDKNNYEPPKIFLKKNSINELQKILKNDFLDKSFASFDLSINRKIFFIKIKKNLTNFEIENLGAQFYNYALDSNIKYFQINKNLNLKNYDLCLFLYGAKLKSYEFNLYKSNNAHKNIELNLLTKDYNELKPHLKKFEAIVSGTNFARDLVSEPPNVLYPQEYVKRLIRLRKLGVKVTVYNESKLKKLGMNSLLGVGKGSSKESYLVTLEWRGIKKKSPSLSFVGKGVCFDTGGISLKPAKFMEEMKYDMAGSAVVAGLIKSLAERKAKINVVGVVGLVENMPGGNAQRPGDIVKAYNGKTIEVLNTDAEGRLVLADALSFTEKKFKPKFIIDLATLTGAIIVSLGSEYAGLFSNDDRLSKQLIEVGESVEEKVWKIPWY